MTGKLVLVTGASSGIGESVSIQYGQRGAHVILLARNEERLESVAEKIRHAGGTATAVSVDLQQADETCDTVSRILTEIGTPDVLVNNAGAGRWLGLTETEPAEAAAMMAVPYLAAFNLSQSLVPAMSARGTGAIAFVTSPASYLAWPNASAYIAARRALAGFAESLQSELKPKGLTVTLAVFGKVATPYFDNNPGSLKNMPRFNERLLPTMTPDQAAEALITGVERKKPFVIKPEVYRLLFVLNALFPKTVASQIRRAAKKARRKNP